MYHIYKNLLYLVLPLQKYINSFEKEITHEDFNNFFNYFITELSKSFPVILKVIVKLVHIEINKCHNDNDKDNINNKDNESHKKDNSMNYTPLMTMMMFNYFISPKMQDIYSIRYSSMRNVNRIIRV